MTATGAFVMEAAFVGFAASALGSCMIWVSSWQKGAWLAAFILAGILFTSPWPALGIAPLAGLWSVRTVTKWKERKQAQDAPIARQRTAAPTAGANANTPKPAGFQPRQATKTARQIAEVLNDFDRLVGLAGVKHQIEIIAARLKLDQDRKAAGLISREPAGMAFVFRGNPGTGKTSCARLLAEVLFSLGALPSAKLVECGREDLVGQYVGETESKTSAMIRNAIGGLLFIDEAHTLIGRENDFGPIAVKVLLRAMENGRGQFGVVVAGYPQEMEAFLASDPGLKDRFDVFIDFADYSARELAEIFRRGCSAEGFHLREDADRFLQAFCNELLGYHGPRFSNGRLMRRTLDAARNAHALRLTRSKVRTDEGSLSLLERGDLEKAAQEIRITLRATGARPST